ncbi:ABC transporter permease [Streptomyces sp. NPDC102406]|uniref:ABC transporter permease n=1 Tax=Streptomyces sp. NPDC102406 TaxID=3366171 RepID=UPI00381A247A
MASAWAARPVPFSAAAALWSWEPGVCAASSAERTAPSASSGLCGVGLGITSGALLVGGWAALAAAALRDRGRRAMDALFMLPVAVPSVVVGLAVLVAFSKPPMLLNGTRWIVVIAHTVLVTAFAHQSVSAAVTRLDPAYEQAAASLGARPAYVLWKVRLPLLLPSLNAAAGLCFALSMGELSATMMLYPPDWMPLPVQIYAITDRGALFTGSAIAVTLMAATLLVLLAVARLRTKASYR